MQRIGVIGLGSIGQRHIRNLRQLFPQASIYAVSASGRQQHASAVNVPIVSEAELIANAPDFVIVAAPASLHLHFARAFLPHNIPLLLEKPLCVSASEAQQFSALIQQYPNAIIGVAYCLRYLESALKMQQLLQHNTIGHIYNIIAQVGQFLPHWRPAIDYRHSVSAQSALGGGALLELSHELDYLQWMFGPLTLCYAVNRQSGLLQIDVEDLSDMLFKTPTGTTAYVHLDFIQQQPHRHCSIIGAEGRLDWDLIANRITLTRQDEHYIIYDEPAYDKNTMYISMLQAFCRKITQADNSKQELLSAITIVELIDAIKQAAPMEII